MMAAMRIQTLRQRLRAQGALPAHEARVLRHWACALPMEAGRKRMEDFLPLALRRALPALMDELAALLQLQSAHPGADGSERLLLKLADGATVESVLLPPHGLCVSTQVGCAVGCLFCTTGQGGLLRQLGSTEIVAQVVLARARRAVNKVVFMGMGEPAHNLDNVLEAIDLLGTAGGIGHKNLVFSTVGDTRAFDRLPRGRVIEIYGPESSGKTTLTLQVIAEMQKLNGTCAFIDAEHALDVQYASKLGVQLEDLLISQPDTGEQALEIADALLRSGSVDLIVIDSVAALTPKAEIEGEMGDSLPGLQARLMSQALRKLTGTIKRSNCLVIFINQIRMKIGVMFGNPETTTGGNALKFYASVRLDIRRIGAIKKGDEVVTIGGMYGTVSGLGDDWVELEIAKRTRVRYLKRAISSITSIDEYDEEEEDEYIEAAEDDVVEEADEVYVEDEVEEAFDEETPEAPDAPEAPKA